MKVTYWPIEKLIPYPGNPRKNDHAIDRMVAVFKEYGVKIPLLIRSSGEIVDGHLRWKAAQKLGMKELPVITCDEWTETQIKAFRLLVNRSANWAEWDETLLAVEFEQLEELHFDLSFTGFESREIDDILFRREAAAVPEEDETPELLEVPVSRPDDVWICGGDARQQHRVACGDATVAADVTRLLGPARPALMTTDPSYGVHYDPLWREQAGLGRVRQTGKVANDDRIDWSAAYELFPGDIAYVWHAGLYAGEVADSLRSIGFDIRAQIIWAKQHFAISRGNYHWQHEPCWFAVRRGKKAQWRGDRTQSTLWQVPNLNPFGGSKVEDAVSGHGTQKPTELMRRPILNHTASGEGVFDPFLGSGTTLVAAERTRRRCYGMDIDARYVDLAVRRWQDLTGQQAVLEANGQSFAAVRQQRTESAPRDAVGRAPQVDSREGA